MVCRITVRGLRGRMWKMLSGKRGGRKGVPRSCLRPSGSTPRPGETPPPLLRQAVAVSCHYVINALVRGSICSLLTIVAVCSVLALSLVFDLPAAIWTAFSNGNKEWCVCFDSSEGMVLNTPSCKQTASSKPSLIADTTVARTHTARFLMFPHWSSSCAGASSCKACGYAGGRGGGRSTLKSEEKP